MKKIYCIAFCIISINISAQNYYLGVKTGLNNTYNLRKSSIDGSTSSPNSGFLGGVTMEIFLNKTFSVSSGLIYEQTGFKEKPLIPNQNGGFDIETHQFNADILAIPLTLGGSFGNTLYGNLQIGFVPSVFLNATYESPTERRTISDEMNTIDFGFLLGGIIGYKLTDRSKLFSTIQYKETFGNHVEYYTLVSLNDYRYRAFSVTIGYAYALSTSNFDPTIIPQDADHYLSKSKRQKSTGTVLISTGLLAGMIGILYQSTVKQGGGLNFDFTGAYAGIGGGVLVTTGIIYHIMAAGNKDRAGKSIETAFRN